MSEHSNPIEGTTPPSAFAGVKPGMRPIDPDITLLIPTIGRDLLRACLGSVLAGERWPGRIIVVDQGGNDEIAAWLDDIGRLGLPARYVRSRETGRAKALNRGLRLVETPFVVITDDDCLADRAWIRTLGHHLREQPGRVYTGRILAAGDEPVLTTVLSRAPAVLRRPGLYFDSLSGGNFAAAMDVFRRVGLFDDDPCVACSEDGEWAYRALRRGVEIAFVPDSVISHQGWRTREERIRQYERYARTRAAFFGKYLRRGDLFLALRALLNLGRASRRWLLGTLRGDRESADHGRAYVRYFLPGLMRGLASKRRPPRLGDAPAASTGAEPV